MTKITIEEIDNLFFEQSNENSAFDMTQPITLNDIYLDLSALDSSDVDLFKTSVRDIVSGSRKKRTVLKPDPISALLMNADRHRGEPRVTNVEYQRFEITRIADKWRGNRIGTLNELICCLQPNMKKSSAGKLDILVFDKNKNVIAIAEVKNRFNTMNAASAIRTRKAMESLVLERGSTYFGCDAILVERIPKKDGQAVEFNPSDPSRGQKGNTTDSIKRMGLNQFLTQYGKVEHLYTMAVVLLAETLREQGILPEDYDLRFIFKLMKDSLS